MSAEQLNVQPDFSDVSLAVIQGELCTDIEGMVATGQITAERAAVHLTLLDHPNFPERVRAIRHDLLLEAGLRRDELGADDLVEMNEQVAADPKLSAIYYVLEGVSNRG